MSIFNKIYSLIQNERIIAEVSIRLSRDEIDNVNLIKRLHYFSDKKAVTFIEATGEKVIVDEKKSTTGGVGVDNKVRAELEVSKENAYKNNLYNQVKDVLQIAVDNNLIVPYEKCRRGEYVLIHFPFYNGTMRLKGYKTYDDVYWWCGSYRDLTVYACGNKNNRIDDANNIDKPLWDPSGGNSSIEFFNEIKDYVLLDRNKYSKRTEEDLFDRLSCSLHNGTMRGYKGYKYQGWYEMLLRCDCVDRKDGGTKIFGSPVFVTFETDPGYGWYLINQDTHKQYYQECNGECIRHFFESEYASGHLPLKEYKLRKMVRVGYDFSYRVSNSSEGHKLRILYENKKISQEDIKALKVEIEQDQIPQNIENMKAFCITTRELRKKIKK